MCRNIKPLFNYEPVVSDDEVKAAALQFVRKISGFGKPSQVNQAAFDQAVEEISCISQKLLNTLETNAPKRNRKIEIERAKIKNTLRYGDKN